MTGSAGGVGPDSEQLHQDWRSLADQQLEFGVQLTDLDVQDLTADSEPPQHHPDRRHRLSQITTRPGPGKLVNQIIEPQSGQ